MKDPNVQVMTGLDASHRSLETAHERLRLDRLPTHQREKITLVHGSLLYRDKRLAGYDAAVLSEVIEHIDPSRLEAVEETVFHFARPRTVIITTPNADYNVVFEDLPAGSFRHKDHRFEWTRAEFRAWAEGVAARHSYAVRFADVGPEVPGWGSPTQMGVFTR